MGRATDLAAVELACSASPSNRENPMIKPEINDFDNIEDYFQALDEYYELNPA